MDESTSTTPIPNYRCHKEVWAVKIKELRIAEMPKFAGPTCRGSFMFGSACGHCERCTWELSDHVTPGSGVIIPAERGYCPVPVTRAYIEKHKPQAGGYFVVYADGYQSFSPAQAFEEGYTRIG